MKESIAAIKWVVNVLMVVAMFGAGWLGYKFVTEPGYLAELTTGVRADRAHARRLEQGPASPEAGGASTTGPVVTSRLPQASALPPAGAVEGAAEQSRSGRGTDPAASAGSYPARTAVAEAAGTAARPERKAPAAYQPPVAQRKVVRVGE